MIVAKGLQRTEGKIEAIKNAPRLKNVMEPRLYMEFFNYYAIY